MLLLDGSMDEVSLSPKVDGFQVMVKGEFISAAAKV